MTSYFIKSKSGYNILEDNGFMFHKSTSMKEMESHIGIVYINVNAVEQLQMETICCT